MSWSRSRSEGSLTWLVPFVSVTSLHCYTRRHPSPPPLDLLAPVLGAYVSEDPSYEEMLGMGFEADVVQRVMRSVDRNEFKRRQGAVGIKITPRAFGRDRRMPIVNRYQG